MSTVPVWRTGAFAGEFGDAYIKNTNLEGGQTGPSIITLNRIIRSFVKPDECSALGDDYGKIENLCRDLDWAAEIDRSGDPESFTNVLDNITVRIKSLRERQRLLVPGGWATRTKGNHAIFYVVECLTEGEMFSMTVCNTGQGIFYHPMKGGGSDIGVKPKVKTAMHFENIPIDRMGSADVWYMILRQKFNPSDCNGEKIVYEVILPHLAGRPLHDAVDVDLEKSGHWETAQRSGTCFYRCILSVMRYAMKCDGFTQRQQKEFFYWIRVGFLKAIEFDLSTHENIHEFNRSDAYMIELACNQTGMAASKLGKGLMDPCGDLGCFRVQHLQSLEEQIERIQSKVRDIARMNHFFCLSEHTERDDGDDDTSVTFHQELQRGDRTSFPSLSATEAFEGFQLIVDGSDRELKKGTVAEASPSLFVDLIVPFEKPQNMSEYAAVVLWCWDRCNNIRSKTGVSAASVALHQVCALVEHTFLTILRPPPPSQSTGDSMGPRHSPWPAEGASLDIDVATQRSCLQGLDGIASHYFAAVQSMDSDRAEDAAHTITMGCIFIAFDAVVHAAANDSMSPLTEALRCFGCCATQSLVGTSLSQTSKSFLICRPDAARARNDVLAYLEAGRAAPEESTECLPQPYNPAPLFEYESQQNQYILRSTSSTSQLVQLLRVLTSATDQAPPDMANLLRFNNLRYNDSVLHPDPTSFEMRVAWIISSWPTVPEFAYYRNINFLFRVSQNQPNKLPAGGQSWRAPEVTMWLPHHSVLHIKMLRCAQEDMTFELKLGERSIAAGTAALAKSPANIEQYVTPFEDGQPVTEEDILHHPALPNFDNTLSPQEAEQFFSYLIVPHLASPLVLNFFDGDRIGLLLNPSLQRIVESILFEPSDVVFSTQVPQDVPATRREQLGTLFGIAMEEMLVSPDLIFKPLKSLCECATDQAKSGYNSSLVDLLLYILRITIRFQCMYVDVIIYPTGADSSSAVPSQAFYDLLAFLNGAVMEKLQAYAAEAASAKNVEKAAQLYTHIALIFSISVRLQRLALPNLCEGSDVSYFLRQFLSSAAYVVAWHSKQANEDTKSDGVAAVSRFRTSPAPKTKTQENMTATPISDVFGAIEQVRGIVMRWMKSSTPQDINSAIDKMVSTSLQHSFQESSGWQKVTSKPLVCTQVIESEHPYSPSTDWTQTVCFPGSSSINLYFDIKSCTEPDRDYVVVSYPGSAPIRLQGPSGSTWPGASGSPALNIPGDIFIISFHSDDSVQEWGFKVEAVANVCMEAAKSLSKESGLGLYACQLALKETANYVDEARVYMATHTALLIEQEEKELRGRKAEEDEDVSVGLFQDSTGYIQANLQTCEVYIQNRMSMPVPTEICKHDDFQTIFGDSVPYCTMSSHDTNRKVVQITCPHGKHGSYEVMAWTSLQPAGIMGSGRGAMVVEGAGAVDDDGRTSAFNLPIDGAELVFCGEEFVRYEKKSCGWLGQVFDSVTFDRDGVIVWCSKSSLQLLEDSVSMISVPAVNQTHHEGHLLMKATVSQHGRDLSEIDGHPGNWFEVRTISRRRIVQVFALREEGRKMQRSLVYANDARMALSTLAPKSVVLEKPLDPRLRFEAGSVLSGFVDDDGRLQSRPGVGMRRNEKVHSLTIRRSRLPAYDDPLKDGVSPRRRATVEAAGAAIAAGGTGGQVVVADELPSEEFVSRNCLRGLIPDSLLEEFEFWRTGPHSLRGYSYTMDNGRKRQFGDTSILVELDAATGTAQISRLVHGQRRHRLMNLARSFDGSNNTLWQLANVVTKVDTLSHILAWASVDRPEVVDIVELPRLKATLVATSSEQGGLEFVLANHDGLILCHSVPSHVQRLYAGVTNLLPLRSASGQYFFLVPNYGIVHRAITSCPFAADFMFDRSSQWFDNVQSRFYVYPVHASCAFVEMPSLSAALYWTLLCFLHNNYAMAARLINTVCHTDLPLTSEQRWILSQFLKTHEDNELHNDCHPDAHACRLLLALVCLEAGEKYPSAAWTTSMWNLRSDYTQYLALLGHVSQVCRLSESEERIILRCLGEFSAREGLLDQVAAATASARASASAVAAHDVAIADTDVITTLSLPGSVRLIGANQFTQSNVQALLPALQTSFNGLGGASNSSRSTRSRYNTGAPGTQYFYHRPRNAQKTDAVKILSLWWDDFEQDKRLQGEVSYLGFSFLYELLTGQARLELQPSDAVDDLILDEEEEAGSSLKYPGLVQSLQEFGLPYSEVELDGALGLNDGDRDRTIDFLLGDEETTKAAIAAAIARQSADSLSGSTRSKPTLHPQAEFISSMLGLSIEEGDALLSVNGGNPDLTINAFFSDEGAARESIKAHLSFVAAPPTVDSREEGPHRRPVSWQLAKLLTHAAIVLSESPGIQHHILAVLVNAVEADHQRKSIKQLSKFPLFPYISNAEELTSVEGLTGDKANAITAAMLSACIAYGSSIRSPPEDSPPPRRFPTTIEITADDMRSRPQLSDCGCSKLPLTVLGPEWDAAGPLLVVTEEDVAAFSAHPLRHLACFTSITHESDFEGGAGAEASAVASSPRGYGHLLRTLPFDLSGHALASNNPPAAAMIKRMEDDLKRETSIHVPHLGSLKDLSIDTPIASLEEHLATLRQIDAELAILQERDSETVYRSIQAIEKVVNGKRQDGDSLQAIVFRLKRGAGQVASIWFEFLAGSLLSTRQFADLHALNPFLTEAACDNINAAVVGILLRFVRARQATSCRLKLQLLSSSLQRHLSIVPLSSVVQLRNGVRTIQHMALELATELAQKRHYVSKDTPESNFEFDPRFLIFEFITGFLLRSRQIELVTQFMDSHANGSSSVHQMIMGAGKTQVITPLLALMLADGRSLVTMICPQPLLEQSRVQLRSRFSHILPKRVLTLNFDRSAPESNRLKSLQSLYHKLEEARKGRAIVCTTPQSVKALFLKYLDLLQQERNVPELMLVPSSSVGKDLSPRLLVKAKEFKQKMLMADELAKILKLWGPAQGGVALLDEVDLLLHPLKSELNFPVGREENIPLLPQRFELPLHLLDAFIADETTSLDGEALSVRSAIAAAVDRGFDNKSFQRQPHVVLLNESFYRDELVGPVAQWALLWLRSQDAVKDIADQLLLATGLTVDDLFLRYLRGSFSDAAAAAASLETLENISKETISVVFKLLNLSRDWISTFLPHVLSKIHRVSYGLISETDLRRWKDEAIEAAGGDLGAAENVFISRSRRLLAVPFVGKDVPSPSAEFAHPEVLIGVSVLAYRYNGLRRDDISDLVKELKRGMLLEPGPFSERPSRILFEEWKIGCAAADVVPLELLQTYDDKQMSLLVESMRFYPAVISHYLSCMVFPTVLKYRASKLQANGVDLGGDMLFGRRFGFSGTPSDLLPLRLGPCNYEPGSEAEIIRTLSSKDNVEIPANLQLKKGWTVDEILDSVATGPYSALIDTGALITGYSTEQIARKILQLQTVKDPEYRKEVCVFLDDRDRKMVVDGTNGVAYELDRCGVSADRRFTFYDHVHTTGIDIKQSLDAVAVCTLGKDMTLRDYAQGCWRMRGLGRGQRIHVLVIEEIGNLIQKVNATEDECVNILAWLTSNSMQSERLQHFQLQLQTLSNIWRRQAFQNLLKTQAANQLSSPSNPMLATRFHPTPSPAGVKRIVSAGVMPSHWLDDKDKGGAGNVHKGEYRKGKRYCCALEGDDSSADGSMVCMHRGRGGIVRGPHWSCCGCINARSIVCQKFPEVGSCVTVLPSAESDGPMSKGEIGIVLKVTEGFWGATYTVLAHKSGKKHEYRSDQLRTVEEDEEDEKEVEMGPTSTPKTLGELQCVYVQIFVETVSRAQRTDAFDLFGVVKGLAASEYWATITKESILPTGTSVGTVMKSEPLVEALQLAIGMEDMEALTAFVQLGATKESLGSFDLSPDILSAFDVATAALTSAPAFDSGRALDEPEQLDEYTGVRQNMDLFLERLEIDIDASVVASVSHTVALHRSAAEHKAFLVTDEYHDHELILPPLAVLDGTESGDTASGSSNDRNREIVQEQEKEKDEEKEMQVFQVVHPQGDRDPQRDPRWRPEDLLQGHKLVASDGMRQFYPLKEFALTLRDGTLARLPFPDQLFVTDAFAPLIHTSLSNRRLKNVNVFMTWTPRASSHSSQLVADQGGKETAALGSVQEAQTSSAALLEDVEGQFSQRPIYVMLTLAEAETVRRLVQRNADIAALVSLHTIEPPPQGINLTGTDDPQDTDLAPVSPRSGSLVRSVTEELQTQAEAPALLNVSLQSMRFFNGSVFFDDDALIWLLDTLKDAPCDLRQQYFESMLAGRLRDQPDFAGTAVAHVFEYDSKDVLLEVRQSIIFIRRALERQFRSVESAFDHFTGRDDSNLNDISLTLFKSGLMRLNPPVAVTPSQADMVVRYVLSTFRGGRKQAALRISKRVFGVVFYKTGPIDKPATLQRQNSLQVKPGNIFQNHTSTHAAGGGGDAEIMRRFLSHMNSPVIQTIGQLMVAMFSARACGKMTCSNDSTISTDHVGDAITVVPCGVKLTGPVGVWCFEVEVMANEAHGRSEPVKFFAGFSEAAIVDRVTPGNVYEASGSVDLSVAKEGDVYRFYADFSTQVISIAYYKPSLQTLQVEPIVKFSSADIDFSTGLFPFVSFESSIKFRFNLGNQPFSSYIGNMPIGCHSVQNWVRRKQEVQYVRARQAMGDYGCLTNISGSTSVDVVKLESNEWKMSPKRSGARGHAFPTVFLDGVVLTQGQWYYEVTINSRGAATQIGWADLEFIADNDHGQGVGDDKSSWAYDGDRKVLWHGNRFPYGKLWKAGDVLGVACDLDLTAKSISFSLNGKWLQPVAFSGIKYSVGLTPSLTAQADGNQNLFYTVNFGPHFKYSTGPDRRYRGVQEWVEEARGHILTGDTLGNSLLVTDSEEAAVIVEDDPLRDEDGELPPAVRRQLKRQKSAQPEYVPLERLTRVPIVIKSGQDQVLIDSARDGCSTFLRAISADPNAYPTVVADRVALRTGKWCFEVKVLQAPANARCSIGFALAAWGAADWSGSGGGRGVGDDLGSWAVVMREPTLPDSNCALKHAGSVGSYPEQQRVSLRSGSLVTVGLDCDLREVLLSVDADVFIPVFQDVVFDAAVGLTPAISLGGGTRGLERRGEDVEQFELDVNFGEHPFINDMFVTTGYRPVQTALAALVQTGPLIPPLPPLSSASREPLNLLSDIES